MKLIETPRTVKYILCVHCRIMSNYTSAMHRHHLVCIYTQKHIVHTHIHTYTHAHIHTYTHTHIHTYTHTYIHTYIYIYIYIWPNQTQSFFLSLIADCKLSDCDCSHRLPIKPQNPCLPCWQSLCFGHFVCFFFWVLTTKCEFHVWQWTWYARRAYGLKG